MSTTASRHNTDAIIFFGVTGVTSLVVPTIILTNMLYNFAEVIKDWC